MPRVRASAFLLLVVCAVVTAQNSAVLVKSNTPGAEVFVDDVFRGRTANDGTLFLTNVPMGNRRITLRKTGYAQKVQSVNVRDITVTANFTLRESVRPPTAVAGGARGDAPMSLMLSTNVAGGSVYLDGRLVGRTQADGSLILQVPPGRYTAEVRKNGYQAVRVTFMMSDMGKRINLALDQVNAGGVDFLVVLVIVVFVLVLALVGLLVRRALGNGVSDFGKFRLLEVVGKGGMAVVYRARDKQTRREVALKLMDAGLLKDRDLKNKFMLEGQAIARINQAFPAAPVVRVFECGEIGGTMPIPYIAMELLKGPSLLDEFRRNGDLPLEIGLTYVKRIAEALMAAHQNRIFHRDVTPDNVIVVALPQGGSDIRLIDFGVAKHEYTSYQTLDGSIAGKPPYMSPEQCRGKGVGPESDVYSLGIILYMVLEGRPPFTGANPLDIMRKHEKDEPPPVKNRVRPEVVSLLERMLDKRPSRRPSAGEVYRILDDQLS